MYVIELQWGGRWGVMGARGRQDSIFLNVYACVYAPNQTTIKYFVKVLFGTSKLWRI